MLYEKFQNLTDERIIASLIGISKSKFASLTHAFTNSYHDMQEERLQKGEIKRVQAGGQKGHLDTFDKKLFFILFYLKTYPTFDVLGFQFGFSGGHAHAHVSQLLPVLERALAAMNVLPERTADTPEAFRQLIEKYSDIIIDGVECACVRPQDELDQKAHFSGKKKTYGQSSSHI